MALQLPRDVHLIGTPTHFLRPSSLDKLIKCQVWYTMMIGEDDAGGAAAQTGSLVHAAVAAFHNTPEENKKVAAAIEAIGLNSPHFPLADLNETRLFLTPYMSDPRNSRANVIAVECPVSLTLDPHPLDPTKQPIHIRGTLDQIRVQDGRHVVPDLKTGAPTGWAMIHDYAYQQAAYMLAARASGFPAVDGSYLIRAAGYRTKTAKMPSPDGVFWWMPFTVEGAWALMDRVRLAVATLRMGYVEYGPGPQCSYCPMGGLQDCQTKANEKLFSLPVVRDNSPVAGMTLPTLTKQVEVDLAKLPAALRAFAFPAKSVSV